MSGEDAGRREGALRGGGILHAGALRESGIPSLSGVATPTRLEFPQGMGCGAVWEVAGSEVPWEVEGGSLTSVSGRGGSAYGEGASLGEVQGSEVLLESPSFGSSAFSPAVREGESEYVTHDARDDGVRGARQRFPPQGGYSAAGRRGGDFADHSTVKEDARVPLSHDSHDDGMMGTGQRFPPQGGYSAGRRRGDDVAVYSSARVDARELSPEGGEAGVRLGGGAGRG